MSYQSVSIAATTAALFTVIQCPVTSPASAAISYNTIALTGTDGSLGPGQGAGVTFSGFAYPVLNNSGQVAVKGILTGTGVNSTNNTGAWANLDGSLTTVVRKGSAGQQPDLGTGVNFRSLAIPLINDAGQIEQYGFLTGTGIDSTNDSGIWVQSSGGFSLVAHEGSSGPGPGIGQGVVFSDFDEPVFNNAGHVAFEADITGPDVDTTNEIGIWTTAGGSPTLVARKGIDGAYGPGVGSGIQFLRFNDPIMNDNSEVAFRATLSGTGVNSSNDNGIWLNDGGTLTAIAREGNTGPGPGLGAGIDFVHFGTPKMNAAGDVIFFGQVTGQGINFDNDDGIWKTTNGTLTVLARAGTDGPLGPNLGTGVVFSAFDASPKLNEADQTTFWGKVTGTGINKFNDTGIWTNFSGTPTAVVMEGTDGPLGPGMGPGVSFKSVDIPVFNNTGEFAFVGELTGTGPNGTVAGEGLWATHKGELIPIVREGDPFDIDPTEGVTIRGVDRIGFSLDSGGEDGQGTSFNNDGMLVFELQFYGGESGIYTVLIPEPTTSACLLAGLGGVGLRRRVRRH